MYFKREKYKEQLIERMHNGQVKVITGIRQCGKSFLSKNHCDEKFNETMD